MCIFDQKFWAKIPWSKVYKKCVSDRIQWSKTTKIVDHYYSLKLLQWKPTHGKRSRGRPSKSWLDCFKGDYYVASGCNVEDKTIVAEDRKEWMTLARLKERVPEVGHSNDLGDCFNYK